jgi:acetyl-CoA carboxylase carboxyl transferase subunit beta
MSWFIKMRKPPQKTVSQVAVPQGLWEKCEACKEIIYRKELENNLRICPKCGYHFRITPEERMALIFDEMPKSFLFREVQSSDPLQFKGLKKYKDQLISLAAQGFQDDAVVVAKGLIHELPVMVAIMDFRFLGGSMGSAVGEKLTRAIEGAFEDELPLIIFSCSGGARMMEGALSLMQMAKISSTLNLLSDKGLPYISVLTDPTTGGVTASFSMLGDVIIAEPGALIGFAGPRVIQQTIRQELPEGFQRSDFLLKHGMLDAIVDRKNLKTVLSHYLTFFRRT